MHYKGIDIFLEFALSSSPELFCKGTVALSLSCGFLSALPPRTAFFPRWSFVVFLLAQPRLLETFRSQDPGRQGLCLSQPLGSWSCQQQSKCFLLCLHMEPLGKVPLWREGNCFRTCRAYISFKQYFPKLSDNNHVGESTNNLYL